ncbi:MAG: ferridoxin [Deltaproteobacteria bacterium RBG_13_47_9]|nr:MAG: ferridoxin [Deltaproteobacteria bacterium RBG_13_47_9]
MGQSVYLKNVVTLNLDQEKCVACGLCLLVCPHAVLSLTNGHIEIANRDACMECGACAKNCPTEALSVRSGVGCATAVMNSVLGRKNSACCCTIDPEEKAREISEGSPNTKPKACC